MVENIKLQVVLQIIPYLLALHVILVLARGLVGKLQLVPRGVALVQQVITAPVLGLVGSLQALAHQGMVVALKHHMLLLELPVLEAVGPLQQHVALRELYPDVLVYAQVNIT